MLSWLASSSPTPRSVSGDGWDRLLRPMLAARRFDEVLIGRAELITGVFHVSIGLEATAGALACVRREDDLVMLGHRNHGHLVALGSDAELLYRELLGRDGGPQRGRAGSLHLADPAAGVPYTSAMLGGGAALATGLALAKRRRREPGVVFSFFGDGAMGEGVVYEAFNLAAAWGLPVVFVCENNATAGVDGTLARVAGAHEVEASIADGRRPRETLAALDSAATRARGGGGAQFLEVGCEPWPGNTTFLPHPTRARDFGTLLEPPSEPFDAGDPVRAEARALVSEGVELAALLALDQAITDRARNAMLAALGAPLAPATAAIDEIWARA